MATTTIAPVSEVKETSKVQAAKTTTAKKRTAPKKDAKKEEAVKEASDKKEATAKKASVKTTNKVKLVDQATGKEAPVKIDPKAAEVKKHKRELVNPIENTNCKRHYSPLTAMFKADKKLNIVWGKSGVSVKAPKDDENKRVRNIITVNNSYMEDKVLKGTLSLNSSDESKVKLPKGIDKKLYNGFVSIPNLDIATMVEICKMNF